MTVITEIVAFSRWDTFELSSALHNLHLSDTQAEKLGLDVCSCTTCNLSLAAKSIVRAEKSSDTPPWLELGGKPSRFISESLARCDTTKGSSRVSGQFDIGTGNNARNVNQKTDVVRSTERAHPRALDAAYAHVHPKRNAVVAREELFLRMAWPGPLIANIRGPALHSRTSLQFVHTVSLTLAEAVIKHSPCVDLRPSLALAVGCAQDVLLHVKCSRSAGVHLHGQGQVRVCCQPLSDLCTPTIVLALEMTCAPQRVMSCVC